jgi:ankyrin repeat protein
LSLLLLWIVIPSGFRVPCFSSCFFEFFSSLPACLGEENAVIELLDAGDDVNSRGAQNRTPLHRAVGKGHNKVVKILVDRGADVNLTDGGGLTSL